MQVIARTSNHCVDKSQNLRTRGAKLFQVRDPMWKTQFCSSARFGVSNLGEVSITTLTDCTQGQSNSKAAFSLSLFFCGTHRRCFSTTSFQPCPSHEGSKRYQCFPSIWSIEMSRSRHDQRSLRKDSMRIGPKRIPW